MAEIRPNFASPPSGNYHSESYTPQDSTNKHRAIQNEDNNYFTHPVSNSVALINTKVNEEAFGRKLNPDEQTFHSLLQQCMQLQVQNGSEGVSGVSAVDNIAQAEIVGRYACAAQDRYVELSQEARRHHAGISFGSSVHSGDSFSFPDRRSLTASGADRKTASLQREVLEQRAERDLWSLLEILTASNLLYDVDEVESEERLQKALRTSCACLHP